jgi:Transposase, Mutator family
VADERRDRCRAGGGTGLAKPTPRSGVGPGLPGGAGGQDAAPRMGGEAGRLCGPWCNAGRPERGVLGWWTSANQGAKFGLPILTELRHRGVPDVLIACVDGLQGFPEALPTVYPKTQGPLCLVHLVRNSLPFVNWKERKLVAADRRQIYRSATAKEAEQHLAELEQQGDHKYATMGKLWRRHWSRGGRGLLFPRRSAGSFTPPMLSHRCP